MAFEIPNLYVGVLVSNQLLDGVGSDLNGQFLAVAIAVAGNQSGQAGVQLASAGGQVFGVLQNKPQLYEAATVMCEGVTKCYIGATVTVGQNLMASTANPGQLIPATSGNYIAGQALEAGVAGDLISVYLKPMVAKA